MKEITNTTVYSKDRVKEFLEIYYFERIKVVRIILNILIILLVITFFINNDKDTIDIVTLIFALFGFIEVNTNMLPRLNLYKLTKNKDSVIGEEVTYVFKKNNFKLNKDEYIDYKTLNKVIETDSAYYLYVNSSRSLLVDKTSFTKEEIDILTNIFKEQVSTYKYK